MGTSRGAPVGSPGGRPTSKSPRTSIACCPSSVWMVTGRPSASTRYSSQWCATLVWSQGTSSFSAIALGPICAPVMLQPPPRMNSLPSATWAASHKSMVTRMGVEPTREPDTSPLGCVLLGSPSMTTPTDGLALPTTERPDPIAPRKRRRGWSLRAHLFAVVIVTIALVVLMGVLIISKDYRRARAEGARNAKFEAGLAAGITGQSKTAGAESISGSIPDLRALIVRSGESLGQVTNGNVASYPADHCNLSFQSFRSFTSGLLSIVLPDGSVVCSSDQTLVQPGSHPYANAQWLTPVVERNAATVVGPLVDPLTKKSSLFVAAPIPNPNAPPTAAPPGVLVVAVDMTNLASTLHQRFASDRYPGNSLEYLVTTAKRDRVVSRSIQPEQSVG